LFVDNVAEAMKQLKSKIDELDATKNKLTDVSVQKDNLQNQWNDVNQVLLTVRMSCNLGSVEYSYLSYCVKLTNEDMLIAPPPLWLPIVGP
jgi:hypothetical protein